MLDMSDSTAGHPEIPPLAALRALARSAENGTVRLDPAQAEAFLREIGAVRDEVAMIGQDSRWLVARSPRFGASPTAAAIGQKFDDRAADFIRIIRAYHQVVADLEDAIRQSVANWTETDQAQAAGFGAEGPR